MPAAADGLDTSAIMRTGGVSMTAVWRWQQRLMDEGVDGLLPDKTRSPRVPKLAEEVADRIVTLTLGEPPSAATHRTGVYGQGNRRHFDLGAGHLEGSWVGPKPYPHL